VTTRATVFATNDVLTANDLNALAGAWNSYTPTVGQGVGVSCTVGYARFLEFGKLVIGSVFLTMTSAGTSSVNITVSVPVTAAAAAVGTVIGSGLIQDASVGTYGVVPRLSTATVVKFDRCDAAATTGSFGTDPAMALAATDSIWMHFMYEAA
jgi:hypothetical protein